MKAEVGPFGYLGLYCSGADENGQARGWGLVGGRWTAYRFFDFAFPCLTFLHEVHRTEDDVRRKEFFVAGRLFIPWLSPQTDPRAYFGGFKEAGDWRRVLPRYTAVEVAAGDYFWGVRIGVNPGEALDFLLGWIGLDIYSDDAAPTLPPIEVPANRPPEGPAVPENDPGR